MSSVFKKTGISEQEQREISSIVFVKLAENGELDEAVISEHPKLFVEWDENWTGKAGTIVAENGNLYLNKKGYALDTETLDNLIESAVLELKKS